MVTKDPYVNWYSGNMYKQTYAASSMPALSRFFRNREVHSILDFYCGTGRNAIFLSKKGFNVSGFDRSSFAIRAARENQKETKTDVKFKLFKLEGRLPYKECAFDAVIAIRALYQAKMSTIRAFAREIDRVTKPNGYIYMESHLKELVWRMPELRGKIRKVERGTYQYLSDKRYYHYFNKTELKTLFKSYKPLRFRFKNYKFAMLLQKS